MIFLYAETAFHSDSVNCKIRFAVSDMYVERYVRLHERLCKPFLYLN